MLDQKTNINITVEELLNALEPLVRRVVREELTEIVQQLSNVVYLTEASPLHQDMQDILTRKKVQNLKFITHEEVWSD
ncbi:hypothetical protein THII_2643 [Thioploca ingrica]|uniref:Uncharacterized protein n=1 Tax=Thioploca ingrica TaxID=40754 RepID=A0A090ANI2_9GAMM|nr:hypothetical protein THII_2643 [Thioploca ingrica]